MKTLLFTSKEADLAEAAKLIRSGEVVAMPTETVYGLAANAYDPAAVQKIFDAKHRPADNPLIVHIAEKTALSAIAHDIPPLAEKIADAFWPGPLTMILPKCESVPLITSGGLDTVGVRMPLHPAARRLIELSGVPLAAPSANRSGYPSPTTAQHVRRDMDGRIAGIIDGGACAVGVESTVLSFDDGDTVRILRPGGITPAQLQSIAPRVIIDPAVTTPLQSSDPVRSPGMKYKHYSPAADVILLTGDAASVRSYLSAHGKSGDYALLFGESDLPCPIPYRFYGETDEARARQLFDNLREMDRLGAKRVFVRAPSTDGIGLAVSNRLLRAAGFEVIDLAQ